MGDLLKDVNKDDQLINGMGITTSLNGLGTIVHMLVIGCMTDYSGQYNAAMKYSGGLVFLAGILSAIISPISNKYRVT
mgnify:CR=1 FL=1